MKKQLILFLLFFPAAVSFGQPDLSSQIEQKEPQIGIVEHLGGYFPADVRFTDETGKEVLLKSLINKPTILNFVYFRCPGLCSPLMNGLADVIGQLDMTLGKDYQVFTISFDAREGTDLAIKKKQNYINAITKPVDQSGWKFFTGDSANIMKATGAIGFKFKRAGNDFIHAAGIVVLSPDRKITRYLNGTYFLPFELKMALIEANKGLPGPTINKILQVCFAYDPAGHKYVLQVTKVSGFIILILAIGFFLTLILRKTVTKKHSDNKHEHLSQKNSEK